MGEKSNGGGVGRDLSFGEIDIVIMCFAEGGDSGLERVVAENEFFLIFARLSGFEVENQLLNLSNFKDAF